MKKLKLPRCISNGHAKFCTNKSTCVTVVGQSQTCAVFKEGSWEKAVSRS